MLSDKEDKGTNHTIPETSCLANSTCSPRILHARVVSRGILEFLFLEKLSRLQGTAEYVFSSWCVLCGIKDQRINTLTFLLFHILPPHWSYLSRRHLRSTERQRFSFRKRVRKVPYRHTKKTVATQLLDLDGYELLTAVKVFCCSKKLQSKMTEQAFFYSYFIPFLLINEGKETNIFNTHYLLRVVDPPITCSSTGSFIFCY